MKSFSFYLRSTLSRKTSLFEDAKRLRTRSNTFSSAPDARGAKKRSQPDSAKTKKRACLPCAWTARFIARRACLHVAVHRSHVDAEVDQAVGVPPFVVVPGHELDEVLVQRNARLPC